MIHRRMADHRSGRPVWDPAPYAAAPVRGCVGTRELWSRFATSSCSPAIPIRLRSHPTGSPSARRVGASSCPSSSRDYRFKTSQTRPPGPSGKNAASARNASPPLAQNAETNDKKDLYTTLFTCRF